MKRTIPFSILAVLLAACSDDGGAADSLVPGSGPYSTDSLAAGRGNTFNHPQQSGGGDNGVTDPAQKQADDQALGGPDVAARLHGAQKLSYRELGTLLADLGVDMTSQTAGSAAELYASGASSLGVPIYASRVPEMIVPSTSALAKQYDIFVAAAPEILANIGTSKRCASVVLVQNGQFTSAGISCLIGKPARPEHVTLANQLVSQASDVHTGQLLAIATLLEAAHTSE